MELMSPGLQITYAGAELIVQTILKAAAERGVKVAVAVAGPGGDLRAFARMDGVSALAGETSRRKCATVLMTGRTTREFGERVSGYLADEPGLFFGMIRIGDIAAFAGGVPILQSGSTAGAVGVSGSSSTDDHELAQLGADAVSAQG
jgi:glc operon protein GlcG